jgi:transaldolase
LTEDVESANQVMESVARVGISMKEVTDKLTADGVQLFADSFTTLLEAVEATSKAQR